MDHVGSLIPVLDVVKDTLVIHGFVHSFIASSFAMYGGHKQTSAFDPQTDQIEDQSTPSFGTGVWVALSLVYFFVAGHYLWRKHPLLLSRTLAYTPKAPPISSALILSTILSIPLSLYYLVAARYRLSYWTQFSFILHLSTSLLYLTASVVQYFIGRTIGLRESEESRIHRKGHDPASRGLTSSSPRNHKSYSERSALQHDIHELLLTVTSYPIANLAEVRSKIELLLGSDIGTSIAFLSAFMEIQSPPPMCLGFPSFVTPRMMNNTIKAASALLTDDFLSQPNPVILFEAVMEVGSRLKHEDARQCFSKFEKLNRLFVDAISQYATRDRFVDTQKGDGSPQDTVYNIPSHLAYCIQRSSSLYSSSRLLGLIDSALLASLTDLQR